MFVNKLNKRDIPYVISDEALSTEYGKGAKYLDHDNVKLDSLEIWSGTNKTGTKILTYFIDIPAETPWSVFIKVFSEFKTVYITYETYGDQVEAGDINMLQNSFSQLKSLLDIHEADLTSHIEDSKIDGGSFV